MMLPAHEDFSSGSILLTYFSLGALIFPLAIILILCSKRSNDGNCGTTPRPLPPEPSEEGKYESIDRKRVMAPTPASPTEREYEDIDSKAKREYEDIDSAARSRNAEPDRHRDSDGYDTPIAVFAERGHLPPLLHYWTKISPAPKNATVAANSGACKSEHSLLKKEHTGEHVNPSGKSGSNKDAKRANYKSCVW